MTALHSEEYRRFIQSVIDVRTRAGVSQSELARRLNIDRTIVVKYEARIRRLDFVEFVQIARALGQDPAELASELARQVELPLP